MTEIEKNKIIAELSEALQFNDYDKFISYFEENAVFEMPFAINGENNLKGISEIKKHFEGVALDPATKMIQIEEVMTKYYHSDPFVIVENFIKGRSASSKGAFHMQSGVAFIRFGESGIVYYKDIPNTIGLAKKAGVLDQLVASWKSERE
ncbi:MAG: nuclear transport factor 2 family protein [Fluviicola sp.]